MSPHRIAPSFAPGLLLLALSGPAAAASQLQADVGLTVADVAYERTVAPQVAVALEAGIFGTYFLPWFDLGDDVKGLNTGVRATWFSRPSRHGLYVTPYVRLAGVRGEDDARYVITVGAVVGWAFRLARRVDLRLKLGAQYIYVDADPLGASTPFVAIDAVVGFRL